MHTWKSHLTGVLRRLTETHGDKPLPEVEEVLMSILEADSVRLQRADGTRLARDATLSDALRHGFAVDIRVSGAAVVVRQPASVVKSASEAVVESRFQPGEAPAVEPGASPEQRRNAFIREFARLEQRHEFMWAGYVVRELLPRFGYPLEETKVVLDRLCAEGVLVMSKVPNPRNPTFPATGVRLNFDHAQVKSVLNGANPGPRTEPSDPGKSGGPDRASPPSGSATE